RAEEPGLHGVLRDVQAGRRLAHAHLLDHAQHEDDAEVLREGVDGRLDDAAELAAGRRVLGALALGAPFVLETGVETVSGVHRLEPLAPPEPREGLVYDDPGQPG